MEKILKKLRTTIVPAIILFCLAAFTLIYIPFRSYGNSFEMTRNQYTARLEHYEPLAENSTSSNSFNLTDETSSQFLIVDHVNLPSLSELQSEPKSGENPIIFIETSCILGDKPSDLNSRGLILNPRRSCAVESTARTNPNRKIYVIYSCPIVGKIEESRIHVKHLLNFKNVKIWFLDVQQYLKDTPLENWNFYNKMKSSNWPLTHACDVVRYVTLWKYGGTYLDMDFIIVRSFDDLGSNFVGAQDENYITNAALDFTKDGIGHVVAQLCVNEIKKNFRGDIWAHNGPDVITKVLQNLCGTNEQSLMTRQVCLGFRAYPPSTLYKIPYPAFGRFFDANNHLQTILELKGSYGIHVWNKMSSNTNITVGSEQPYGLLANKFCPAVYNNIGPIF